MEYEQIVHDLATVDRLFPSADGINLTHVCKFRKRCYAFRVDQGPGPYFSYLIEFCSVDGLPGLTPAEEEEDVLLMMATPLRAQVFYEHGAGPQLISQIRVAGKALVTEGTTHFE